MNIYRFELRSQLKTLITWSIVLAFTLFLLMGGMYNVFQDSKNEVNAMFEGFPKEFAAAFGFDLNTIFSYSGFFSFGFTYYLLLGAIMAVVLSVSTFAREKRAKCIDFLLTKPKSRSKVFVEKLLASLTILLATNLFFITVSCILYGIQDHENTDLWEFMGATLSLFFTQLLFLSFGIFFSTYAKKIRTIAGIATTIGFGSFILSAVSNIIDKTEIQFIAPLRYFEPSYFFQEGRYDLPFVIAAIVLIILCTGSAYLKFIQSDTHAV